MAQWREPDVPHTVQYGLSMFTFFGALIDLTALVLVGLSFVMQDISDGLYFMAQWFAAMVWLSFGYWLWADRKELWRQIRVRRRRQILQNREFSDT